MSDRLRIGAGLVVVAAAVVLFIVLHGGGGSSDLGGKQLTVNGKAVDGVPTIGWQGGRRSLSTSSSPRSRPRDRPTSSQRRMHRTG